MKLILSRKGFDSTAGGVASPVLPNGRVLSLPIPDPHAPLRYRDLNGTTPRMATLVDHLAPAVSRDDRVHLDPDLDATVRPRAAGWRPAFGQASSALGHLQKHAVGEGDLFLFFGWFRLAERFQRRWRFVPGAPDIHMLFGWLQVEKVIDLNREQPGEPWRSHVHCQRSFRGGNSLFIARDTLSVNGVTQSVPGGGLWREYASARVLTASGRSRSHWRLPRAFAPRTRAGVEDCLSYHSNPTRWRVARDHCDLHITPRGQEFVLNCTGRVGTGGWLKKIFATA